MKGLLIVNLGTPKSPTTTDVQAYLQEFLGDPNVIQMPKWLWQPLLKQMILPKRAPRSAKLYQSVWTEHGSPLAYYTAQQTQQAQALLPDWDVQYAMTYQEPNIRQTMQEMAARGVDELVVIPLFPQFTYTATQSIIDQVASVDLPIRVQVVHEYWQNPAYLQGVADLMQAKLNQAKYDQVIFSFHGIPQSYAKKGDPYPEHVAGTLAELRARTHLDAQNSLLAFQSKFGPAPWLKPALIDTLAGLPKQGVKSVLVTTPGFVVDCLETLDEIHGLNRQTFMDNGGERFDVVPPFNASLVLTNLLVDLATNALSGKKS
ncbi:MAG: ferrochelatase [Lactobacillaceae bacterium]|jgi:ferrochelatase|nr:ferrochelatase [Lactobacillaceae bacterium]